MSFDEDYRKRINDALEVLIKKQNAFLDADKKLADESKSAKFIDKSLLDNFAQTKVDWQEAHN